MLKLPSVERRFSLQFASDYEIFVSFFVVVLFCF